MIKTALFASIALVSLTLVSWDETARLAKEIQGSWCGTPERLSDKMSGTANIVRLSTLVRDDGKNGGPLIIRRWWMRQPAADGSDRPAIRPFSCSRVSAQGIWTAIDDDEVSVAIDPQSIEIDIDPADIVFDTNLLTNQDAPALIRYALSLQHHQSTPEERSPHRFLEQSTFDDVKVKKISCAMKFGKDITMSRIGDIELIEIARRLSCEDSVEIHGAVVIVKIAPRRFFYIPPTRRKARRKSGNRCLQAAVRR